VDALDILLGRATNLVNLTGASPSTALTVEGGSGDDVFDVGSIGAPSSGTPVPLLIGGSGTNTIQGPDSSNTWLIEGHDYGAVTGPNAFAFRNIDNLIGGALDDLFIMSDGATLDGSIDGGAGNNTIDYSRYTTPVTVDLITGQATGIAGGIKNINNKK
jgi:hypothetical protein